MRKILCLLLVFTMVFSMVACSGNKENNELTKPAPKEEFVKPEETTPTEPEINEEEITALYDNIFKENMIKCAGNSLNGSVADVMEMKFIETENGDKFFKIACKGAEFSLWQPNGSDDVFVHMVMESENPDECVDQWYKYVPTEVKEDDEGLMESMSSDFRKESVTIEYDTIEKIEFVERKEGNDIIRITLKDEQGIIMAKFDAETNELIAMEQDTDDGKTILTFDTIETYTVELPEEIGECGEVEVMTMYMAVLFSMVEPEPELPENETTETPEKTT